MSEAGLLVRDTCLKEEVEGIISQNQTLIHHLVNQGEGCGQVPAPTKCCQHNKVESLLGIPHSATLPDKEVVQIVLWFHVVHLQHPRLQDIYSFRKLPTSHKRKR
uniref:Uncharacterized protein n=1 Tax=Timema bartmani TaxID=61472 RepID=A0A7R9F5C7_9NEOP|nr:unnamed protein product [Timema bartmani]